MNSEQSHIAERGRVVSKGATFAPSSTGFASAFGLATCVVTYIFFVRFYYPFPSTVEDSFILFRYADHFAAGYGLSWNLGGSRAQGLTGVLWVVLLGLTTKITGLSAPLAAGYVGI